MNEKIKGNFSRIPDDQLSLILGEFPDTYMPNLANLDVHLLETHPNIVVLEFEAYGENDRRLCIVEKVGFVRWLNKVRREFQDDLGFDSD